MEKFNKYLPIILLGAIGLVTLIPFIFTGFSNNDDFAYYLDARMNIWYIAKVYANNQGRFWQLICTPISIFFYSFDNYLISKTINIVIVLFDFIAIGLIAKEIFSNKWHGYLCYLLIIAFVSIKGFSNPIVSYPAYFSGSFLIVLLSIYYALKYKNTEKNIYRIISAILYGIGMLFYESYLTYLPLIILIISSSNKGINKTILFKLKKSWPFILLGLSYCLVYFSYRIVYPSTYTGAMVSDELTFSNLFKTILNYSSGSYPMLPAFSGGPLMYGGNEYLNLNNIPYIINIILSEHFEWVFKSIIISISLYYILIKLSIPKTKQILVFLIIVFLYIFIPNIPVSLTRRSIVSFGMPYYTTTYFSMFAVTLCLTLLIILLCSSVRNLKYKAFLYVFIALIIGLASIINDLANYEAVKSLKVPLNVCNIADKFVSTKEYSLLPENSVIYAPQFFDKRDDIVHFTFGDYCNWDTYFYFKSHKKPIGFLNSKVKLIQRLTSNLKPNYFLNYGRNQYDMDQFFAFSSISEQSKIDSVNNYITSDSVVVYYYSKNKTFSVIFDANNNDKSFTVNDETLPKLKGFVEFDVSNTNYQNDFVILKIKTKEIDLNSIRVTNITKPGSISVTLN